MFSADKVALELGPEWDSELLARLRSAVIDEGGAMAEVSWGVGGSQEVRSYQIQLSDGEIEAIAETYIGLSIRGPLALVHRIAHAVRPSSS